MNLISRHRKVPRPLAPQRRPTPLRRLAAWVGALICAILCAGVAGPAAADTAKDILGPGRWYESGHHRTWYGSYRSIAEDHPWAWCIDAGLATPYRKAFSGQKPERVEAPRLAYLLAAYASDDRTANHVALAAHVKLSKEVPHRHAFTPKEPAKANPSWGDAQKIYDAQTADADRNAGPYTVKVAITDGGDGTGAVSLGLISAAGRPVAGYPFELKLTGAAAAAKDAPRGEAPRGEALPGDADLPEGAALPDGADEAGGTSEADGTRGADSTDAAEPNGAREPAGADSTPEEFTPDAASADADSADATADTTAVLAATSPDKAGGGADKGADPSTIRGTTAAASTVVPLRFSAPTDRKVTAKVSVRGVPSTYVDLYRPKSDPKSTQNVVTESKPVDVAGEAALQVLVPSKPAVRTEISEDSPEPGSEVSDRFSVSGLNPGQRVDVEHTLYALPTRPQKSTRAPYGARRLGTVVSKGVGNGDHVSPSIRLPRDFAGWIYWSEVISPGKMTSGWTGEHGLPEETGFVPWRPQVGTKAVAAETTSPTAVHDAGHVVGGRPGATLTVTTTAYGPLPGRPRTSASVPRGTPSLGSWTNRVKIDADGTGTYRTPDLEVSDPGYVTFVTEVRADETHHGWRSAFGLPEETLHLGKPAVSPPPPATPTPPPATTPVHAPTPPVAAPPALPVTGPASSLRLGGLALAILGCGVAALGAGRMRRR